jgi:4-amino-4-deoxy-L-arabinose transferase-like glycosyltransferase
MNHLTRRWLITIVFASVLLRIIAAIYLGNTVIELPGTADQISYHTLAQRVLQGFGFSFGENWWPATRANEPTAHWSYLYTLYLVAVYKIFGVAPLVARLIQAIAVGILQPLLGFWIARRLFNEKTGLVTAGWFAFYGYFIYYAGILMTEMFYISALLGVFLITLRIAQSKFSLRSAVSLGVLLGCTFLLRQLYILFVPFLCLWVAWAARKQGVRAWLGNLAVAGSVSLLMILPFTIFNYARFHRFVLLNTNAGYVMFWGNHPIYGTKFVPILTPDMPSYNDLLPKDLLYMDEAALDSALMQRGLGFIIADPGRYALLSISRIPPYFEFWPSSDSGVVSNLTRVVSFGLALPFMIIGMGMALRKSIPWKADPLAAPAMLFFLFGLVYSLMHILTWALVRYRLPVDAAFLPFASLGLLGAVDFARGRLKR